MPIPESIGMLVTKLRKKLSSSTVDTYTLNRVYIMALVEMIRAYGYEEAMRKVFEWGYLMGHAYLIRLDKEIEQFSFSLSSIKLLGRSAWYIFSGTDPETQVEALDIHGTKLMVVRVRDPHSPWDEGFKLRRKAAVYPAGAYEGASNVYALLTTKGKWVAYARNTRSLAAGDPYTEITLVYTPKDTPEKIMEEALPGFFDEISYEQSRQLYKKVVAPG